MAEDGSKTDNDLQTTDDERSRPESKKRPEQRQRRKNQKKAEKPKCRRRIDQLAIPNRRLILALYQDHAEHLSKEKVERVKVLLQELYAMTPEETEKYFEHLRQQSEEISKKKNIKYMLKRLLKKRKRAKQIRRAYEFVKRLLIKSMDYASKHPIPPLVSVRLRNLSNIILEQISDLKNVKMPNRDDPDPIGYFLIQVADWMAIAVEHLYYGVQLKKNRELEKIEKEAKAREESKPKKPKAEDKAKVDDEEGEEEDKDRDDEAVLSEALLVSEME